MEGFPSNLEVSLLSVQEGMVINSDAACNISLSVTGIAISIRRGTHLSEVAMSKFVSIRYSTLHAELMVIKEDIRLVFRMNFSAVVVESDALETIHLLNRREVNKSEAGIWVLRILELGRNFEMVEFRHIRRIHNEIADSLTREVVRSRSTFLWVDHFPLWLSRKMTEFQSLFVALVASYSV